MISLVWVGEIGAHNNYFLPGDAFFSTSQQASAILKQHPEPEKLEEEQLSTSAAKLSSQLNLFIGKLKVNQLE